MARTRATIYCSIHGNADWLALSPEAKLLYLTIDSQTGVSLAGCLDYNPAKWAKLTGHDIDTVHNAIADLVGARFLAVDENTFEVVVRTFTRWDVGVGANRNTIAGMWSAWRSILSPDLRQVVLDAMPPELRATADPSVVPTGDRTTDGGSSDNDGEKPRSNDVKTADPSTDRTTVGTAVPTTSSSSSTSSTTKTLSSEIVSTTDLALVPNASPPTATVSGRWEAFWDAYPRKTGKAEARKAWDRARKRASMDRIDEGLAAHLLPWRTFEEQFIPHPATWLNGGRYDDEPPKPRTATRDKPAANRAKIAASLARMEAGS